RIVPAHLSIGGAAGGLREIGILEPRQIALHIVKQPASAIDQERPEENATRAPADQEPVEKRRPPHQQEPDESLHRRIDNPAFRSPFPPRNDKSHPMKKGKRGQSSGCSPPSLPE